MEWLIRWSSRAALEAKIKRIPRASKADGSSPPSRASRAFCRASWSHLRGASRHVFPAFQLLFSDVYIILYYIICFILFNALGRCSITLCFVFTQGARELVATDPVLASQSLGLLRGYLREVLRNAGDGSGYECQEDEGAFMWLGSADAHAIAYHVYMCDTYVGHRYNII